MDLPKWVFFFCSNGTDSFTVLIRSLLKIYRKGSSDRIAVASLEAEWSQDISVNK